MDKKYGFIAPIITRDHYVFGASPMPYVEIRPDGNWFDVTPQKELQNTLFETYNCTAFNTLSQIECYMKAVFGITVNYSDRWLGIIAGTKAPGNDPQTVYEAIRKYGLIPEEMLPFSPDLQNIDEYYSFKDADEEACYKAGRDWLEKYEFFHEWVVGDGNTRGEQIHNMLIALKSSPLCREVYAWYQDERGVYVKMSEANHWTFVYAHDDYDNVEDSYEPNLKNVDQEVNFCKRIYIRKRIAPLDPIASSPWTRFINWLISIFK